MTTSVNEPVLAAAPMLPPSRNSDMYCDVAPVHVSVTSFTVAKKVCPLAVSVNVPVRAEEAGARAEEEAEVAAGTP